MFYIEKRDISQLDWLVQVVNVCSSYRCGYSLVSFPVVMEGFNRIQMARSSLYQPTSDCHTQLLIPMQYREHPTIVFSF